MNTPYGDAQAPVSGGDSATTGGSNVVVGDTSTAESIVKQARSVRDDFAFGDDRVILNPPNWASQSSTDLYNGAVNNNEPGTADEMGQAWSTNGRELHEAADGLYEAITELGGVWVGEAVGAAQGALIGVANASSTAADAAVTMGKRMKEQSLAAAEVKKMPPPQEFSMEQAINAGLAGGPAAMAADIKNQKDAADAVKAEQQRYMDAYTKAMGEVDGSTPDFGPESIGMRPVAGGYGSGSGIAGGTGSVDIGGPGSGAPHVGVQAGPSGTGVTVGGQGTPGGHTGGGVGGPQTPVDPLSNVKQAPSAVSGTAPISTSTTGSGIGAGLGVAALGAGAGLAGVRALAKGGKGKKAKQQGPEQEAAAVAPAGGEDKTAQEGAPAPSAAAQPPQTVGVHETGGPTDAQGAVPPAQVPDAGRAVQPVSTVEPVTAVTGPATIQPGAATGAQPLGEGAVSAASDPGSSAAASSGQVSAQPAGQQAGGQPHGGGQPQPLQPGATSGVGQHSVAGAPMGPMGGGGMAGAGAAGGMGGAGDAEHSSSDSYLIQPDPDDVFGPDEAVTSGVIGAFDDEED